MSLPLGSDAGLPAAATRHGFFRSSLHVIWADAESRKLLLFVVLNAVVTVLELVYGTYANFLALISDGFHMALNCITLLISVLAAAMAKKERSLEYSYGYRRAEVLAAFSNSVFLLFVALFLVLEAFHRVLSPPVVEQTGVLAVGGIGLLVNLCGLYFLRRFRTSNRARWLSTTSAKAAAASSAAASAAASTYTATLNLLADTASSMAVLLSSFLITWKEWHIVDPLVSILIATIILRTVWPLFVATARTLMQTMPPMLKVELDRCIREVSTLDGVLEAREEHFWSVSPGSCAATLYIRVRSDAVEATVLAQAKRIFADVVADLTVQVEKDPPIDWLLPSASGAPAAPHS
eukprot:PLAT6073.1.p1 GENE.PLAT6073.1~~PLAT6073.1.p1  ORF type:complete len:350 (-),score=170.62 PLAT6073.1:84-1133(-)